MRPLVSIVIPAWNEEQRIGETLEALLETRSRLRSLCGRYPIAIGREEVIVVDDGSTDRTREKALPWADIVLRHERNQGKGASLTTGWMRASGSIILFLDADLGKSVMHYPLLLKPLLDECADMTIARLPAAVKRGGFGWVKGLASGGIYRLSGFKPTAPLSGQRAIRKQVLEQIGGLPCGFGIEVGLTIDAARAGYRIMEVAVPFRHRETGRDWDGFCHRGRQFVSVATTLLHRWRHPVETE